MIDSVPMESLVNNSVQLHSGQSIWTTDELFAAVSLGCVVAAGSATFPTGFVCATRSVLARGDSSTFLLGATCLLGSGLSGGVSAVKGGLACGGGTGSVVSVALFDSITCALTFRTSVIGVMAELLRPGVTSIGSFSVLICHVMPSAATIPTASASNRILLGLVPRSGGVDFGGGASDCLFNACKRGGFPRNS